MPRSNTERRDLQIVELYTSGQTMEELGAAFGISRQRVHQIIQRVGGPGAEAARARRREVREAEQGELVADFVAAHQGVIQELAVAGSARADVEARFHLIFPDTPMVIVREGIVNTGAIFDVNVQEFLFSPSVIEAAVWYALAIDRQLESDASEALRQVDLLEARELAEALDAQGVDPTTRAQVTILVANARSYAVGNPEVSITKGRYDQVRREVIDGLGLASAQGLSPWPPTSQTVMKRLGNGYWAEALTSVGLTPNSRGRERGLLRFSEEDYDKAVVDFLAEAAAVGQEATIDGYAIWIDREGRAGRRRPAPASIRLRYGSWNNAKRMVGASGARTATSLVTRSARTRSSVGTVGLHRAQAELSRFLEQFGSAAPHEADALVEQYLSGCSEQFEDARRAWLRGIIEADGTSISRVLAVGSLNRAQRAALEATPPKLDEVVTDMYIDRMLSGPGGGPKNTGSWLSPAAQAELDSLPDEVIASVAVMREVRNYLTHNSVESRERLSAALSRLAAVDERFALRRGVTRRIVLDWLTSDGAYRLRTLAQAYLSVWRAMVVAEAVALTSQDA